MPPNLYRVIMPVPDIEQGVEFYRKVLDMPGEPVAGATRHYFRCGATILALANPGEHDIEFRPNVDHVYFAVADLEAAHRRAQDAGAPELEDEIATRPWGERCFYCRDPFGNPLCFVDEETLFTGEGS